MVQRAPPPPEPADSGRTLFGPSRTISTTCADETGRSRTRASPTSKPVVECPHPSRMEGSCTPFNGAGVDAGEREEPGRTMPVGREFMRGRGRLASTSPAGCPSCRGGSWRNTMARTPAASATWARTGERPRCTPGPLHRCLPGTRDPRTFFSTGSASRRRQTTRGIPRPRALHLGSNDSITGGSHRPECEHVPNSQLSFRPKPGGRRAGTQERHAPALAAPGFRVSAALRPE